MRLIDADAFIEENQDIIDCEIDHPKYQDTLRELIDDAPTVERPHGEWIPCSERLPGDERPVLIYAWNVHHVVARYGQFRTEDGGYKTAWVTAGAWFDNTEIKHKVIAWMPLTEPYRKEGEAE